MLMVIIWAGGDVRGAHARHLRHSHPASGVQHVQVNRCMAAPNPVYMYVCIRMYVYVYRCMYVNIYTYVYMYIYICM